MSGVLAAVYAAVTVLPTTLLRLDSSVLVAGATLATAASFVPVRRRVQTEVDRRFNRSRYDGAQVVAWFKTRTRGQIDLDGLTRDLTAAVERTVDPVVSVVWIQGAARLK